MNCSDCRQAFSDYVDGDLEAAKRAEIDAHLETCAACRTDYGTYRISLEALRAAPPVEASTHFEQVVVREATSQIERRELLAAAATGPLPPSSAEQTLPTPRPEAVPLDFPATRRYDRRNWMVAAAFLVAIAVLIYQQVSNNRTIGALERHFEEMSKETAGNKSKLNNEDFVLVKNRWVPIDEFVNDQFRKAGYIYRDGRLWPKEFYDASLAGKIFIDGSWYSAAEAGKRLGLDPSLPPAEIDRRIESILGQQGYTKKDGLWLRGEDLRNFEAGLVQTSPGVWMSAKDVETKLMAAAGYVPHDGQYFPKDYVDRLRSELILAGVEIPDRPNAVVRHLAEMKLGAAVRHGGLTLYPILGPSEVDEHCALLHDEVSGPKFTLRDEGEPFFVHATNQTDKDVYLLPGDLLTGGAFDRVVAVGARVAPGESLSVPVFSAEPKAWRTKGIFAGTTGHYLAPPLVRKALASDLRQAAVWSTADEYVRMTAFDSGISLVAVYDDAHQIEARRDMLDAVRDFPTLDASMLGMAVAVDEHVIYAEWFGSHDLFVASFDRMVASATIEAARQKGHGFWDSTIPNSVAGVRQFLGQVAESDLVDAGLRDSFELRFAGMPTGSALLRDGKVVHAVVFDPSLEAVERAVDLMRYPVSRGQMGRIKEQITQRLQVGAPAQQRRAAFRELARIPSPEAVEECRNYIRDADHEIHAEALHTVAVNKPDARTMEVLMSLFEESLKKKEYEFLGHAAEALALTGHEKAVNRVIDALEPRGDAAAMLAILPNVPIAVYQCARIDVLKKAMTALIDVFSQAPAGEVADKSRDALQRITGWNYRTLGEFEARWNSESDRNKFIETWKRPPSVPADTHH